MDNKAGLIFKEVRSQALTPGGSASIELDKGYDISSVIARVNGTITVGVAAALQVHDFGMANIISRAEIFADGRRTFEETNGKLAMFANFERGAQRFVTDPAVGVATHNVDALFFFDRSTMDGPRPKDSALHTSLPYMSLLQARFEFGALADVLEPDGTTTLASDLTLTVFQDEIEEREVADAAEAKLVRVVSFQEIDVTANNSNLRVKLPVGNWLRGVKLIAVNDTSDGDDTVINSVKIQRNQDVRDSSPWTVLRHRNSLDYGIPIADRKTGVGYIDLCRDGRLRNLYDLRNATQADLVLDVTKPAGGDGKIYAGVVEYIEQPAARV